MIDRETEWVAAAAGARLAAGEPDAPGPVRATIDSRDAGPGDLFVGLAGANADGGTFAADVVQAGAWGVLVREEHADAAVTAGAGAAVVLVADDPLAALQQLARGWRRELNASVVGITGSTGKTSTKDILAALVRPHRKTIAAEASNNA